MRARHLSRNLSRMHAHLFSNQWPAHLDDLMLPYYHTVSPWVSNWGHTANRKRRRAKGLRNQSCRQMCVSESCHAQSLDTWGFRLSPSPSFLRCFRQTHRMLTARFKAGCQLLLPRLFCLLKLRGVRCGWKAAQMPMRMPDQNSLGHAE